MGNVHFAAGIWCGVELPKPVGKNDGLVRGVRYFSCSECHGLMAPLDKVVPFQSCEGDPESGPYSTLFDVKNRLLGNCTYDKQNKDLTVIRSSPGREDYSSETLKESNDSDENEVCEYFVNNGLKAENETFINTSAGNTDENNLSLDSGNVKVSKNTYYIAANYGNTTGIIVQETNNESPLNLTQTRNKRPNKSNSDFKKIITVDAGDGLNKTLDSQNEDAKNEKIVVSCPKRRCFENALQLQNVYDLKCSRLYSGSAVDLNSTPVANSTVILKDSDSFHLRKSRCSSVNCNNITIEEESGKRDSLECEESLGILTPEQMMDVGSGFGGSRTPSSENIRSLARDLQSINFQQEQRDLLSPNVVDASTKDISLGIIDEKLLDTFASDGNRNMELSLNELGKTKDFTLTRLEETPSPEDLPLDPTPIVESEPKLQSNKKSTNSFITSITSITSLDTGYQGDGEMSRPASRGADNSPLTRRPLPRPQPRRPDPMTDSDFYTESDADNHEEHPLRGDRRVQVIDGTLYGVDPQAVADIYVNNRENMDSSGIFTDIETNTRTEDLSAEINQLPSDVSPSDSSTKTISVNSQNNLAAVSKACVTNESCEFSDSTVVQHDPPKRNAPSPSTVTSSPISVRSPKHVNKENNKSYKMPKRNVPSKVKAMIEPKMVKQTEKISPKKNVGRWDAVMNKISKNAANQPKSNLKDIKSKVFTNSTTSNLNQRTNENRMPNTRQQTTQKTPNNKL